MSAAATEPGLPVPGSLERPLRGTEGGCYVRGCPGPAEHLRPTATGPFVCYCTEHAELAERWFGRGPA